MGRSRALLVVALTSRLSSQAHPSCVSSGAASVLRLLVPSEEERKRPQKGPGCAGLRGTPELPSDSSARLFLAPPPPNPPLSTRLYADAWTGAALEFVVLICVFLSSLVLVHTYIQAARRAGCRCFLVANPKHLPEALPLPCLPSTSLSFLCQSLGPQFVSLNYHSLLQSK